MPSTARHRFELLATQYYVAGRFAAMGGLAPVYGNLLHHAVERYLKAALVEDIPVGRLRAAGHNLIRLWRMFKTTSNLPNLERFDATIRSLDRFENVRYLDDAKQLGLRTMVLGPGLRGAVLVVAGATPSRSGRQVEVAVADVDVLIVEVLWQRVVGKGVVPSTLLLLSKDGRRALELRNRPLRRLLSRLRPTGSTPG